MTKHNVVIPEAAAAELFPYLPFRRKILSPLEMGAIAGGGVGRINSWVESMKSSSPTHANASVALAAAVPSATPRDEYDRAAWTVKHPSALSMFDEIKAASAGKQIVMFLDYDGTLSPIVDDPDSAFMSDAMRAAVRDVARHFPTAIVSGRCRSKVYNFVRLAELYYAGSHGMDIKSPARALKYTKSKAKAVLFQPASEFLPMIDEVYKALVEKTKSIPGAKVENNKFCLSVHYRCVDEKRWSRLTELVVLVLKQYPKLHTTQGRKVWDFGTEF